MPMLVHFSLFLLFLSCPLLAADRRVTWTVNPGCGFDFCQNVTLVHVTANGTDDTIHYIWSFIGRPTLLLAVTDHCTNLSIDWTKLLFNNAQDSINFTSAPHYSFGFVINRLLEFRDINDTGSLEHISSEDIVSLNSEYFHWELQTLTQDENGNLVLEVNASQFNSSNGTKSGNVSVSITAYGQEGYGSRLPHLLHSYNSSQLEMTLNGLETNSPFSRFAVELLFASSEPSESSGFRISEHRSLDDEHTPGVFTVVDLLSFLAVVGDLGGFIQWRPVAYTEPDRKIETSTEVLYYPVINASLSDYNSTLLFAFYSHRNVTSQALNVSFGVSEDGFYNSTRYTVWSLSFGYGQPPAEHLSLLVLLIMGIGLGVPVLLMSIGGLYICLCRRPRAKDELFLSR